MIPVPMLALAASPTDKQISKIVTLDYLAGIADILSFQRIEDYLKQLPKDKVRVWNMDNDTYLNLED